MAEEEQSTIDFFISYNGADKTWAEWIAWQLEEEGFSTILEAWDFRPGANFVLKMQVASEKAKRTIAVLSPNYLNADFTQPEWAAAFSRDPHGGRNKPKTLLPFLVLSNIKKPRNLTFLETLQVKHKALRRRQRVSVQIVLHNRQTHLILL